MIENSKIMTKNTGSIQKQQSKVSMLSKSTKSKIVSNQKASSSIQKHLAVASEISAKEVAKDYIACSKPAEIWSDKTGKKAQINQTIQISNKIHQ